MAGWLLLRRAGLTKEQKQLVQTTVGVKTTVSEVEKALYLTLGQDHVNYGPRSSGSPMRRGRQYRVHYAEDNDEQWELDESAYAVSEWGQDEWHQQWPQDNGYEAEDAYYADDCDAEVAYYGGEAEETLFDIEEYDTAFAAYVDAKKKISALRSARGFYPVVALTGSDQHAPVVAQGPITSKRWFQVKIKIL